jgi:hypothetical protein
MTNILILDESLVDLSEDEQKAVRGGAASCTYASKTYSRGSAVKQDDGNIYRCQADGTWGRVDPARV